MCLYPPSPRLHRVKVGSFLQTGMAQFPVFPPFTARRFNLCRLCGRTDGTGRFKVSHSAENPSIEIRQCSDSSEHQTLGYYSGTGRKRGAVDKVAVTLMEALRACRHFKERKFWCVYVGVADLIPSVINRQQISF